MQELFQQWPTIQRAHELIRQTRSEKYFAPWDAFTRGWAKVLGVPVDLTVLCGPNLGAVIDTVFEKAPGSEHDALKASIQAATRLDEARAILRQQPLTLLDALKNHIAYATLSGYERLSGTPALADLWLEAWARAVQLHAAHQMDHEAATHQDDHVPETRATFEQAVELYVGRFTHTDAFSTTMIAVFPFLSFASEPALQEFVELSERIARYMRLIADVVYNPTERINVGLFTLSLGEGISLAEAHRRVVELHQPAPLELQRRVSTHALEHEARLKREFAQVLERHAERPEHAALQGFFQAILKVARYQIDLGLSGSAHSA